MEQAEPIIEELDQLINTAYPNNSEKVILWKKSMRMDVDDEG
jgi:hypothetical protein